MGNATSGPNKKGLCVLHNAGGIAATHRVRQVVTHTTTSDQDSSALSETSFWGEREPEMGLQRTLPTTFSSHRQIITGFSTCYDTYTPCI